MINLNFLNLLLCEVLHLFKNLGNRLFQTQDIMILMITMNYLLHIILHILDKYTRINNQNKNSKLHDHYEFSNRLSIIAQNHI